MPSLGHDVSGGWIQHTAPRCLASFCLLEAEASPLIPPFVQFCQGRRRHNHWDSTLLLFLSTLPSPSFLNRQLPGPVMERQASNARGGATGNRRPAQARGPLAAAAAAAAASSVSSSTGSPGSSYSSASSCVTSDATSRFGGGGNEAAAAAASPEMVLRGCPRCFMYVMVQVKRQRCPRCNTSALVRLFEG